MKPPAAAMLLLVLACASAPETKPAPTRQPAAEEDDGEEGGVEGGVSGGTADTNAPLNARTFLPPGTGITQRDCDIRDPRYSPKVRPEYLRPGSLYWGLFKVCVADSGKVKGVATLKSTGVRDVDHDWQETIKTWPHRPYLLNGQPVSFCYPMRIEVRMPRPAT